MPILAVDDDEITLASIQHALQLDGREVVTATNGREALEILGQGNCRIVISDWMMPEVNGLTLCRAIRAGEFGAYV